MWLRHVKLVELSPPSFAKLGLVRDKMGLDAAAAIGAVGGAFMMHYHGLRLIEDPPSGLAHPECQIGVLIVGGHVKRIEAAELAEQRRFDHDARPGTVVRLADMVVFWLSRVVIAPVIVSRA